MVGNITKNSFFKLRFYGYDSDHYVFISASTVPNGLLPLNYNILYGKVSDISKSNGKKPSNYKIKVYGPLNECLISEKGQFQIYIQNNCFVVVDYYEQTEDINGIQPYCSFKIPINSLSWSNELLSTTYTAKYFDNFKNIETVLTFTLMLKKNNELTKIIPKLNPPEVLFDELSTLRLDQIKISNCYLYEVSNNCKVQFVHIDIKGKINAFNSFKITENKTEYIIPTSINVAVGGRGTLYLINL